MTGRTLAFEALAGAISISLAAGAAIAQDRYRSGKALDGHDLRVQSRKYAGWHRAPNGSWVQPVGDTRYPGASPSAGGAILTKDDMDSSAFQPAALVNPDSVASPGSISIRYAPTARGEQADRGEPYVDEGSVYSQENTVPAQP